MWLRDNYHRNDPIHYALPPVLCELSIYFVVLQQESEFIRNWQDLINETKISTNSIGFKLNFPCRDETLSTHLFVTQLFSFDKGF